MVATLDLLPAGARAVLGEAAGSDPTILRLIEMGMTPGTEVVVERRAPLGDPIEIALRGTRICLRRADAMRFAVEVGP
jgi:ferrous iron transport protein A